jgi:hypothetical protein
MRVPEAGDLLVIPASYPQRASSHPSSTATRQRKVSHRTVASRPTTASPYKTAALTTKHRPTAN